MSITPRTETSAMPEPVSSEIAAPDDTFAGRLSGLFAACRKHRRESVELLDYDCWSGNCPHDDECPELPTDVCRECYRIAAELNDEYIPAEVLAGRCSVLVAVEALEPDAA